jgi:hypothetical protein
MRMIKTFAALMLLAAGGAGAEEAAPPPKAAITDMTIINSCGERVLKMFAQYGAPKNFWVMRGRTVAEDDVLCSYGAYGFRVRDGIVRCCFFWTDWAGPIRGVKMGNSREDVVKVLGSPQITIKDKDGAITSYGYRMKEQGIELYASFDKNGRVKRVEIDLPD